MTNKTLESSKIKENELKKDHEKHDKNGKGDFKDVLAIANDVEKLTFNEMISVNNVNIKRPRKMI